MLRTPLRMRTIPPRTRFTNSTHITRLAPGSGTAKGPKSCHRMKELKYLFWTS